MLLEGKIERNTMDKLGILLSQFDGQVLEDTQY